MAITEQQQAMLDNMCYVANIAQLGTLIKQVATFSESISKKGGNDTSDLFNDINNNLAGAKVFAITAVGGENNKEITVDLSSLTPEELSTFNSIQAGARCCVDTSTEQDNIKIVSVDGATGKIVVENTVSALAVEDDTIDGDPVHRNYILILDYPNLGNTYDKTINAHAEGENTQALARGTHSEGRDSKAIGQYAHSEGLGTMAGYGSHSEGRYTKALGNMSHSEGHLTNAYGHNSHSEGRDTTATGYASHAEGNNTIALGAYSHTEGNNTKATGVASHVEGNQTEAGLQAHAEGDQTKATGETAHAEGRLTKASGASSHAEGKNTKATGDRAHAEGMNTKSTNESTHSEGIDTEANGRASHSEGIGTIANGENQHTQGKYNAKDTENKYAHIIGNGTSDTARSNAHTVDWNGNAWFAGDVEGVKNGTTHKLSEKANAADVALLQYYGTTDITISDSSYFTVNETGETITGLTDTGKTQTELVIPYEINGIKITTLFSGSDSGLPVSILDGNSTIIKVVIPKSVTTLGRGAFYSCSSLKSIDIPDSVTSIGDYAFVGSALTSINIPNSMKSIGSNVFGGSSLASVNIPNSVTSIGYGAFSNCFALKSIDIPDSVTSIGSNAFLSCSALTSVNIPKSVTNIANGAFGGRNPATLTIYCEQGSYAETFAKNNNNSVVYTDVKDMATKTELERLKYYGDKDIIPAPESYFTVNETGETITGLTDTGKTQTELVIPYEINGKKITTLCSGSDGVSGPPVSILNGNNSITKVVIPKSVTTLGGAAFANCKLTSINIPNSVTSIEGYAFWSCSSLTSIYIPDSVTSIGDYAFMGCTSLTSIDIPNSVTSIGDYAFWNCTFLTSINIPNSVTSIKYGVFNGCTALTKIEIPDSIVSIESEAFYGCTNLKIYCEQSSYADTYAKENSIPIVYTDLKDIATETELERLKYYGDKDIIPSDASYFTVSGNTITGLTETGKTQTGLVIPYRINGVDITSIGQSAFEDFDSLKSINIPNSVTSIGAAAFSSCISLKSINIPDSVTSIGQSAFFGCESLTSINIPNSVITIGPGAFEGCTNLKIYCEQGSYAETYAKENNIPIVYTDIDPSKYLTKDNTTEFTPTGDYQPATKKYVDDIVIEAGGGDMLRTVYDKDNDGIIDDVALLQYYGTTDITISDSSYFTVNETGETITGLTDTGKTQTELVIPYKINGVKITTLFSGSDGSSGPPMSILNGNSRITKVVIPKSVTTLGGAVFFGLSSLASVNIPNSVTNIANGAFHLCSALTKIDIPNSVTSIGDDAFVGCSLKSIDIPNSVTSIGDDAFTACSALTSVNIPNSVTSIGNSAFDGRDPATLTIYCEQGSYAETFAKKNNNPVVYTDIDSSKYLTKDNTQTFMPTSDYQPATKKYVDDVLKTAYDTDHTGVVDNAEKLGGQLPSYYAKASTSVVVTLPNTVADWTTNTDENGDIYYTKSFSNETFTSDGAPFVGVNYSDTISIARQQAEAYNSIDRVKVSDGTAIFYCFNNIPSVSLDIQIKMVY